MLVQNDPARYDLEVTLVVSEGDTGEALINGAGQPWGYLVSFDPSSFISCSLIATDPGPVP